MPIEYATCQVCGKPMKPGGTCAQKHVYIGGKKVKRVPHESALGDCHDCNVGPGKIHHWNCDMERCPVCGLQLLSCECEDVGIDSCVPEPTTPKEDTTMASKKNNGKGNGKATIAIATFELFEEKKHSVRYNEVCPDDSPVLRSLYVGKEYLPAEYPAELTVTIEA